MIETYANAHALAEAAAHGVAMQLEAGLRTGPRAALVATGGRSPGMTYDRLSATCLLDWTRVVVTLSDERCVAADAPDSNARLVRERLLKGEAAKAHLLPLWPRPQPTALRGLTPFDAVMLGMGQDGHVASLIRTLDPRAEALIADVPEGLGSPPVARVTLTLSALLASRAIFLLVAGGAKREVVDRALSGEALPVRSLLAQETVPVRVLWCPSFER